MPYVKEVLIKDWAHFESATSRIVEDFVARTNSGERYFTDPLFRGQANTSWPLVTTLERFSSKPWSITSYNRLLSSVLPAVTSLTARTWPLAPNGSVNESHHGVPPSYEFMIYLRHFGFPSPLLDWTRSPYVAAFFAYATHPPATCEAVAIFAFREYVGHGKEVSDDRARIIGLGPYAVTHERHYAQQCQYTICKKRADNSYLYCNHEEALGDRVVPQDLLTKYIIPVTERGQFLRKLESMNIHAFSLFRDEGSLMHTLAYREIEKHDAL